MVKGVNRQVLEIHETGCDYFEKALFFVRPEYSAENEGKLRGGALKALRRTVPVPKTKKQKTKSLLLMLAELLASAGAGAALTALIIR